VGDGLVAGTAMQIVPVAPGMMGWLVPVAFSASGNANQSAFHATDTPLAEQAPLGGSLVVEMRASSLMPKDTCVAQDRALNEVFSDPSLGWISDELLNRIAVGA
jgi:hypothetical protein